MIKYLLLLVLCLSFQVSAESCFPLYEAEAQRIQDKDGYTKNVGGQVYVQNGQLAYWPGIKVQATIDNWARDLVAAIKWGPYSITFSSEDPRKDWLEGFRKSIKRDCDLPENNHDKLRSMLTELMEDGSFCPNNKILEPKFFGGQKAFKKILKQAVKDQRFPQYCQSKAVADDSFRDVKDVNEQSKKSRSQKSSGSEQ